MKLHTMLPAIACALCFGFAAGQEAGAADQAMPPMGGMQGGMDMSKAGQASFDKMDADKDGKVSQEEFLKAHPETRKTRRKPASWAAAREALPWAVWACRRQACPNPTACLLQVKCLWSCPLRESRHRTRH